MIQSKAFDVLKELKRKEFQQFEKYLNSNFFTSNKNLKKLYSHLRKFYPSFENDKLTKENIYKAVYGNKAYDDFKVRKLLSDLYKETERFIVILNIQKDKHASGKILLEEFDERKLDNLFTAKYDEVNKLIDKDKAWYYYSLEKHFIEWRNISFHLERGMQQKIALNIYKRSEYIIFYFLSDLFTTLSDIESNIQRFNISAPVNLAEEFISNLNVIKLFEYIEKNDFPSKDILKMYYLSYMAFKNFDDNKYYIELKKHTSKNFDNFHETTQRAVVTFLIIYCVRKTMMYNKQDFEIELNEHYNTYINYKLFKIGGENYFRIDLFLRIFSNFFKIGKFAEAESFLKSNIENIQPGHRKNMLSICNALTEFEKKDFAPALREASKIKSNTQLYKQILKILILKIHYELNNYEIAKESANNFSKSLSANSNLGEYQKEACHKFLHYYNILWKTSEGKPGKINLKEILQELTSGQQFPESDWMIKKVEELLRK